MTNSVSKSFNILLLGFSLVGFGIPAHGQTLRANLLQDSGSDWSIGGSGEDIEFREPE